MMLNWWEKHRSTSYQQMSCGAAQVSKLQAGVGFIFDDKRTLRPFRWAQHLAGIDFLPEAPPLLPDSGFLTSTETAKGFVISSALTSYREQHRVFTVLQQLRARKKAHLALKWVDTSVSPGPVPDSNGWSWHTSRPIVVRLLNYVSNVEGGPSFQKLIYMYPT